MSEVIVEDVHKIYKTGRVQVHALRGVSFTCRRGEFLAIQGPSGSGKTTLLNIIGTLDKPDRGKVLIDGVDVTKLSEKQAAELRLRKIGFIFQFFELIPVLTALENVELPMILAGVPREERRRRAMELLKLVGLEHRAHHRPFELSGGEQQRVAIARALANNPSLILADEPTGELDEENTRLIIKLMRDLVKERGVTCIVVTHDPEVARAADRILYLVSGRIVREEVPGAGT